MVDNEKFNELVKWKSGKSFIDEIEPNFFYKHCTKIWIFNY